MCCSSYQTKVTSRLETGGKGDMAPFYPGRNPSRVHHIEPEASSDGGGYARFLLLLFIFSGAQENHRLGTEPANWKKTQRLEIGDRTMETNTEGL